MNNEKIKTGDHVRFLNSVGGGVIQSIDNRKGVVQVLDESGFVMPALVSEVVVVTPGSGIVPKVELKRTSETTPQVAPKTTIAAPTAKPERSRSQEAAYEEITALLAYLPVDSDAIGDCDYECYLINESNYDLRVMMYGGEEVGGQSASLLYDGVVPFDSIEYLESFAPAMLAQRRHVWLQMIAYKSDTPFAVKPIYEVRLRLEGSRFFKRNAFIANDYFPDDDAILFPLIDKDKPCSTKSIDPKRLEYDMMRSKQEERHQQSARKTKEQPKGINEIEVVDLHIDKLVDSTTGMSNRDILDLQLSKARKVMQLFARTSGKRIVFIHGKGEGVLRQAVLDLLRREHPKCALQDASFQEYGFGATEVRIN